MPSYTVSVTSHRLHHDPWPSYASIKLQCTPWQVRKDEAKPLARGGNKGARIGELGKRDIVEGGREQGSEGATQAEVAS